MNRPIRTVAIFCMFLFLALMINVSYLQFWHAEDLNEDPLNARVAEAAFSRERGDILAGEGRDQVTLARSREFDDQYKYLRVYPRPAHLRERHRLPHPRQPDRDRAARRTPCCPERTSGSSSPGSIDLAQNQSNKGGNVLLTLDPEAQQAAYDALLPAVGPDGEGSVVAIEPKTGRILAMVSLPSYDPNDLATHDFDASSQAYERLDDDERGAAGQPRDPDPAVPRLDVQGGHGGGGDRERPLQLRRRRARPAPPGRRPAPPARTT